MELNPAIIPWGTDKNSLFLNPQLPEDARTGLIDLAESAIKEKQITGHIVLASSGSTVADLRYLKLVFISQKSFLANAKAVCQQLAVDSKDLWLQWLPRFHVGGLSIEARQKISGCQILSESKWNLKTFEHHCAQNSFQFISLVPTQVYDLVNAKILAPKSLKALVVGGGFLNPKLKKQAEDLGWKIYLSYGMTETSSMISLSSDEFLRPLPGVELQCNATGILGIKSPSIASFTAAWQVDGKIQFVKLLDTKGWYWTQDLVQKTDKGLQIKGRASDFIKIGGEGTDLQILRTIWEKLVLSVNLDPQNLLLLAMPSERLGVQIDLVVLSASRNKKELVQTLVEQFSKLVLPNQCIRQIHWVEKIPRSDLGKVLWSNLTEQLQTKR